MYFFKKLDSTRVILYIRLALSDLFSHKAMLSMIISRSICCAANGIISFFFLWLTLLTSRKAYTDSIYICCCSVANPFQLFSTPWTEAHRLPCLHYLRVCSHSGPLSR